MNFANERGTQLEGVRSGSAAGKARGQCGAATRVPFMSLRWREGKGLASFGNTDMIFDFVKDIIELALIVTMVFFLIHRYIRWRRPHLTASMEENRLLILLVLGLVLIGIKVSDSALTGESGPMDRAVLLFVHRHVPAGFGPFFQTVTIMGSFDFFLPLLVVSTLVLIGFKKWFELLLIVGSAACGALVIYGLKTITGRERPALWETRWYWGTSFPSGHTLETACVAMALALCLGRVWPGQLRLIRVLALLWVLLVGFSRLFLGVHWPTDVLAAACIGMLLPITVQFVLRFWLRVDEGRPPGKTAEGEEIDQ